MTEMIGKSLCVTLSKVILAVGIGAVPVCVTAAGNAVKDVGMTSYETAIGKHTN